MAVHLITGDDESLLLTGATEVLHRLVGDGDRSLLVDDFDGPDYEVRSVVDAAQTSPFLTDFRVVVARGIGRFNAEDVIPLVAYLKDPLPTTELVLVAGGGRTVKALADAIKAMNMFLLPQINVPILGVVENMAWFTPAELPENKYFIFGEGGGKKLAKESNSVLLGQIPIVQSIREGGDTGVPAVLQEGGPVSEALLNVAKNVLRQIAVRNEMMEPTRVVKMGE